MNDNRYKTITLAVDVEEGTGTVDVKVINKQRCHSKRNPKKKTKSNCLYFKNK